MSGVSLKARWTIKKHWNNKFYYTVASCLLFLYVGTTQPWQLPATTDVCKTRSYNYSFWAPDYERCVAQSTLNN
jgi:hypothetical protein